MILSKKIEAKEYINKFFYSNKFTKAHENKLVNYTKCLKNKLDVYNSEETNKMYIRDFLQSIGFKNNEYNINPDQRIDLSISKSNTNYVIFETKKINSPDMITESNINRKSLHELILYFMRERIDNNNNKLTYLIITDGIDWFIFDAVLFNKIFAQNKNFLKEYNDSQVNKSTLDISTLDFYNDIAFPYVDKIKDNLEYVHLNLYNNFNKNNSVKKSIFNKFIKMLSPQTLMKKSFVSDSNVLDQKFYSELLYIMGLRDRLDGKGIERLPLNERQSGSLLELVYESFISNDYNFTNEDQKFDFAINVISTWINRILFLKLLESQLIKFNNDDNSYKFISSDKLINFNQLNELFFGVLAKPVDERGSLSKKYKHVPYLNSSLFEKSVTENEIGIKPSDLSDSVNLKIMNKSVLKNRISKNIKELPTLKYLLTFLDSYSFSVDAKSIENDSGLINSSVLGLIFEKINGYKDGSYYTPGFVTSFMVHKSIDRAIVDKFQSEGWKVNSISDIANITPEHKSEFINILKDFKIVDPAVGSGHFLVSALNYLVKLRSYLRLLPVDLRMDVNIDIENDELLTTINEDNNYFIYRRDSITRQKIQKSLFDTKLDIIEHNLFGVDINQNSVNITRLRLWIELLKNSYYDNSGNLRTMPNLEMNIKTGNSVVSKYGLDSNLGDVTEHTDYNVTEFKNLVQKYRDTDNKSIKKEIEKSINEFKSQIVSHILDKGEYTNLINLSQKRYELKNGINLFESSNNRKKRKRRIQQLNEKISLKEKRLKEIEDAPLFAKSFEWRFEFPEVLNYKGKYNGFDLVIANPPYIGIQNHESIFKQVSKTKLGSKFFNGKMDFFYFFMHLALDILSNHGSLAFITTNYWLTATYANLLRNDLMSRSYITDLLDFNNLKIFSSALGQNNMITFASKNLINNYINTLVTNENGNANAKIFYEIVSGKNKNTSYGKVYRDRLIDENTGYFILDSHSHDENIVNISNKLQSTGLTLKHFATTKQGLTTGANKVFLWSKEQIDKFKMSKYEKSIFKPLINGSSLKNIKEPLRPDCFVMYIDKNCKEKYLTNLSEWIRKNKNYKRLKNRREVVNKSIRDIELSWPRNKEIFENKYSIYVQKHSKTPRFTLNNNLFYLKDDAYAITLNNEFSDNHQEKYILMLITVLNSTIVHFWLLKLGRKKGKSLELYPQVLNTIPMPNVYMISDADLRKAKNAIDSDKLLSIADILTLKWFNINKSELKVMKSYINANQ